MIQFKLVVAASGAMTMLCKFPRKLILRLRRSDTGISNKGAR